MPSGARFASCGSAAVVAFIFAASPAWASNPYTALGAGSNSCGTWVAEIGTAAGIEDRSWVLGFLTAFDLYGLSINANVARGVNSTGLLAWIDNYCRANPLDMIGDAVEKLIAELRARSGAR